MIFNYLPPDPDPEPWELQPFRSTPWTPFSAERGHLLFHENRDHPGGFWVDQGLDEKVDAFEPCEICAAIWELKRGGEEGWTEGSLCRPCDTRLRFSSAINEVLGNRPVLLDEDATRAAASRQQLYRAVPEEDERALDPLPSDDPYGYVWNA